MDARSFNFSDEEEAPKVYEINEIGDIFKIPKDRRRVFLAELPEYIEQTELIIEKMKSVSIPGVKVKHLPSGMKWIDDGKPGINNIEFKHEGKTMLKIDLTSEG